MILQNILGIIEMILQNILGNIEIILQNILGNIDIILQNILGNIENKLGNILRSMYSNVLTSMSSSLPPSPPLPPSGILIFGQSSARCVELIVLNHKLCNL